MKRFGINTKMSEQMYYLDTTYGCGGVIVKDEIVSETCPLYKWMQGKKWNEVLGDLIRANILKKYESSPNFEEIEDGRLLPSIQDNNGK